MTHERAAPGGRKRRLRRLRENGFDGWTDALAYPQPIHGRYHRAAHAVLADMLDFMRGDEQNCCGSLAMRTTALQYYRHPVGDFSKDAGNLEETAAMGAKDAVFHISHAELEHAKPIVSRTR
jgi:hypothetical protein